MSLINEVKGYFSKQTGDRSQEIASEFRLALRKGLWRAETVIRGTCQHEMLVDTFVT